MATTSEKKSNRTTLAYKDDLLRLAALYALSIAVVYYLPSLAKTLYFFGLLFFFLKSKKNYFWFAFILVLENSPGRLFSVYSESYSLSILDLGGFRDIYLQEFFTIVAIFKFALWYRYEKLFYSPVLKWLLLYGIFLFITGFYFGADLAGFLRSIRMVLPFSFFIVIPAFFKTMDDYKRFFSLIFPVALFVLIVQLSELLILNRPVASYFGETHVKSYLGIPRLLYSTWILLIAQIGALFFLADKNNSFSKTYLHIVALAVIFSFFLSATRGYIVSTTFMYLMFYLFLQKKRIKHALIGVIAVLLFSVVFAYSPQLRESFDYSVDRMRTLEALVEGDPTADGTLVRISDRRPRVMNKFKEQPLIGYGFSREFSDYADVHTGNETLLLKGGLIGYFLMAVFWLVFNIKLLHRSKFLYHRNSDLNALVVFIIGFAGLFLIHSSSGYVFNYRIDFNRGMAIAVILFFVFADRAYKHYLQLKRKAN